MKSPSSIFVLAIAILFVISTGCFDDDDENHAPVAEAGPDQFVELKEGQVEVYFSAARSSDEDDDDLSYTWDFDASDGDNGIDSTEKNPSHKYYFKGTYTVTLRVSDGKLFSKDTMKVTVTKQPGDVRAVISTEDELYDVVHEGEAKTVTLNGYSSSTTEGDIIDYEWDFNFSDDFHVDDTGAEVSHEFESGRYRVALRVTNDSGETDVIAESVKMNYNMSYNDELEADEGRDYQFPLNTLEAFFLKVTIVSNNSDNDGHDLDIRLYYPNGTQANNTDEEDESTEEIRYDRYGEYRDRLDALGEWKVTIYHEDNLHFRSLEYDLYIDVAYHS